MESDQNANSEHGNPCSVKKKQSKYHIFTGGLQKDLVYNWSCTV